MKSVTVLASLIAKDNKITEAKALLHSLLSPTREEEGCINYDLHQDLEKPTHFFLYENWTDKRFLDKHLESSHLQAFFEQQDALFAAPIKLTLAEKIA